MTTTETDPTWGSCDQCEDVYDVGSRIDHDANLGLCWECSPHHPRALSHAEFDLYLAGADWDEVFPSDSEPAADARVHDLIAGAMHLAWGTALAQNNTVAILQWAEDVGRIADAFIAVDAWFDREQFVRACRGER
jgi:hypothetical protein